MAFDGVSGEAARRHGPLLRRVDGVLMASGAGRAIAICDASEAILPVGGRYLVLEKSAHCALRSDGRAIHLSYRDEADEATVAAALAACTAAGAPIAADPQSLSILALAERLAMSEIPVLINGPTGTGKEVLSRFIHQRSPRAQAPFVAVNCAAMPETMLEAMLFGHQKGAFTGATQASEGFFRAAHGGTLLLDEIAEMPLALQAKLLRALQEGEVVPIGATAPVRVDVRVIACANRDLPTEVSEGRFRADLYYRLNVFPLSLDLLRERGGDIAPLAFAMLLRHGGCGGQIPWISPAALSLLRLHGWPGNIRELENVMRRALLLAQGGPTIEPAHIVFDQPVRLVGDDLPAPEALGGGTLANVVQLSQARVILDTLEKCGGSRVAAARQLGISERTLRYRLAAFRDAGIPLARVAGGRR